MALADRTPPPVRKGPRCVTCVMRDTLTPEDRETFDHLLDGTSLTANQILAMLAAEGYGTDGVTCDNVERHRKRGCMERRGAR